MTKKKAIVEKEKVGDRTPKRIQFNIISEDTILHDTLGQMLTGISRLIDTYGADTECNITFYDHGVDERIRLSECYSVQMELVGSRMETEAEAEVRAKKEEAIAESRKKARKSQRERNAKIKAEQLANARALLEKNGFSVT